MRRRDEHDVRLVRLHLTKQARSIRTAIETERDTLAQRATAGLTDAEHRALVRALTKIVKEFTDESPEPADEAPRPAPLRICVAMRAKSPTAPLLELSSPPQS